MSKAERDAFVAGAQWAWGVDPLRMGLGAEALRRYPDKPPAVFNPEGLPGHSLAPKRWRCKGCGYLLPPGPDVFLEIGWWKDESGHAQHWTGKHPNDPDGKWCGPVEET